ncbi:hypothetical protein [Hyphomonas sp.]|jgi:hypothetical protein|uniref:hypothetical protein n=1 Tax=Hyphomonas sp. TaxID=87 RepID=UPI0035639753
MTDEKEPYAGEFMDAPRMAPEAIAARKRRNFWLGLALFGFVVLVAVTTVIRLSNTDLSEGAGFYYSNSDGRAPVGEAPALPPGMTEEQAAPPAGLEPGEAPE